VAGDTDDDGHLDIWFGNELHTGPFLDQAVEYGVDPKAYIEGSGSVYAADVDVDGDGHEDVITMQCCHTAWVHHGPFDGRRAGPLAADPDPEVTWLGDFNGCAETNAATVLFDHLGPGHHAVALSIEGGCGVESTVFDLMHPRGTHVPATDDLAGVGIGGTDPLEWDSISDLDGDGFGEALWGDFLYSTIARGPISDDDLYHAPPALQQENGFVVASVGDINGDGIDELTGMWIRDWSPWDASVVLLFSPHEDPLDLSTGLTIAEKNDVSDDFGHLHADLDGDGRSDIVDKYTFNDERNPPPPELLAAGEIRIWYGIDLLAAENARHPQPRHRRFR
jgi:hypothetical protein